MKKNKFSYTKLIINIIFLYWAVSMIIFSISHPEMTETEKILNTWDVLTWQW